MTSRPSPSASSASLAPEPAIGDVPASVAAMIGTVLERRYPLDAVLDARNGVCRLQTSHLVEGRQVDVRVAALEASDATRVSFGQEAELVARLDHPGCPRVFEFGSESDGTLFTIVSPEPQERLESLLGSPMDPTAAVEVACQILDALAHVHAQGVVHRNVNEHSVRLSSDADGYYTHLEDFSAARLTDGESDRAAMQADVFAVGELLYTLLAGQPPFTDAESRVPRGLPAGVPRPIAHVVMRMLAINPTIQFAGAAQADHALRTWHDGPVTLVTGAGDETGGRPRTAVRAAPTGLQPEVARAAPRTRDSVPTLQQAEPGETLTASIDTSDDPPAVVSAGAARVWPIAVAVALLVGTAGLVVSLRPWEQSSASADVAASVSVPKPVDGPTVASPASVGAAPTMDDGAPSVDGVAPPAGGVDLMQLLTVVNNADLSAAPEFGARHGFLDQLRASKNTAALIDEQLNAILDLAQASAAPRPCAAFESALGELEAEMSERSRSRLADADAGVVAPGPDETPADCTGHQTRLAALTDKGSETTRPSRSARPRKRGKKPRLSRRLPEPPTNTEPPRPSNAGKRSRSATKRSDRAKKLDDELRPYTSPR